MDNLDEMDLAQEILNPSSPAELKQKIKDLEKKVEVPFAFTSKDKLFEAMLLQNTYTDIVELVLKFLKS